MEIDFSSCWERVRSHIATDLSTEGKDIAAMFAMDLPHSHNLHCLYSLLTAESGGGGRGGFQEHAVFQEPRENTNPSSAHSDEPATGKSQPPRPNTLPNLLMPLISYLPSSDSPMLLS